MTVLWYILGALAVWMLIGIIQWIRRTKPTGREIRSLFRDILLLVREGGLRFLAMFAVVGIPWALFFLLWGGIAGLAFSAFVLIGVLSPRGYTWVGHGPGGPAEAARRNTQEEDSRMKLAGLFALPALAWVFVSIVLSCILSFRGYAKWPPY